MFDQITILGNVGKEPDMSYTNDGIAYTKFSMAVNKKKKVDGKMQDVTTWYNCTAFRTIAETINQYVSKGQTLFVQGSLDARLYKRNDGDTGLSLDVIVEKFSFAGGSKKDAKDDDNYTTPIPEHLKNSPF